MILDLFLILLDLRLHFVQTQIECRNQIVAFVMRDEIVLMLGIDQDFHPRPVFIEGDRDPDRGDALEVRDQLFGLPADVFLMTGTDASMLTSNGD